MSCVCLGQFWISLSNNNLTPPSFRDVSSGGCSNCCLCCSSSTVGWWIIMDTVYSFLCLFLLIRIAVMTPVSSSLLCSCTRPPPPLGCGLQSPRTGLWPRLRSAPCSGCDCCPFAPPQRCLWCWPVAHAAPGEGNKTETRGDIIHTYRNFTYRTNVKTKMNTVSSSSDYMSWHVSVTLQCGDLLRG